MILNLERFSPTAGCWAKLGLVLAFLTVSGAGTAKAITPEQLLDDLQRTAFDYFWNEANPANGLVKDRSTAGSPSSIAATGFGLTAICIGIDHGWVSRVDGRDRVLTTLQTFWNGPQGDQANGNIGYQGLFYHFLDMTTATRTWNSELSTIDTALLVAGIIDAREYFDTADPVDVQVRALADSIVDRVDWEWTRASGIGIRMGWMPGTGFDGFGTWVGYNEAMIMYILALGSNTNPIPTFTWFTWTSGYNWDTQYGYTYVTFPPMFGHQYSHCWIDFKGIQDIYMRSKGITYFENSRRAAYAAREYSIDNPGNFDDYGPNVWGLTASDGPFGYNARGAPPAQNDDGTITPTAAAASIAFAPEIVIPALVTMFDNYGPSLWSTYGFKDAFNPTQNWFATDVLGIDQGPIIIMIENYLNESVWNRFMQNPNVQQGLALAGFEPATTAVAEPVIGQTVTLFQNAPNPFGSQSTISYRLDRASRAVVDLIDVRGRAILTLVDEHQSAGQHHVTLDGSDLPNGVYFYRLRADGATVEKRCVLVR